ncbi:uncharacterized protein MKK02DRAFT_31300 [Dioszegia hungarica]|uniref:Uncharacterized protein n=1 Tax=Dioszegia hungarica TaxID=4972 RepID=A0AA38LYJ3_9TREE|nr:uncharacterized protein MKK02DRAFT_31300 [Dioszegia hungarica]KAI9639044.1 hypothetical protein MKK02DRAFT_31300 [Dioszegia hungarica]
MAPQVKGMKVRFEQDPNNPHAPPRRIIEKAGFWERLVGVKNEQPPYLPLPPVGYLPPAPSGHSTAPRPLSSTISPAQAAITATNHPSLTAALRPTPFPLDFKYLPRSERHAWEKQRKEEIKYLHGLDKEQRAAMKAEEARKGREEKEARDRAKQELKARNSAMKLEKKLGYRPMPQYIPAPTDRPLPPLSAGMESTAPNNALGQPTSWMLLPTLEQFGLRRPFDAPGQPGKVDIGGTEWPMMSRTMTHALQVMGREERVRLDQAGHTWSPAWYRD